MFKPLFFGMRPRKGREHWLYWIITLGNMCPYSSTPSVGITHTISLLKARQGHFYISERLQRGESCWGPEYGCVCSGLPDWLPSSFPWGAALINLEEKCFKCLRHPTGQGGGRKQLPYFRGYQLLPMGYGHQPLIIERAWPEPFQGVPVLLSPLENIVEENRDSKH